MGGNPFTAPARPPPLSDERAALEVAQDSMDAVIKGKAKAEAEPFKRPSRDEAEEAVRTLIAWAGDNPNREGLLDTPQRVVDAYEEWFGGYREDPLNYLSKTFEDVQGYDDIVMLRD